MGISYDPAKNERNIRERKLSFERAAGFDFETALIADYSPKAKCDAWLLGILTGGCTCSATSQKRMESA
jgi:uncharacterized DUF497 family protein